MAIKITDPNDETKEIEVFTPEEVAAREAEVAKAKDEELQKANAEVEKYKRVSAEQTQNFKKLNEMTEEEKGKMTAAQIEDRKRIEAAEARAAALEKQINDDTEKRIARDKDTALARYHGGDEKLKEVLEKNYEMIKLDGNDTDTIMKRAEMAANMERGKNARVNPLMTNFHGASPSHKDKSKSEEFLKSDKAAEALKRMGN